MTDQARIWNGQSWTDIDADAFFALPPTERLRHLGEGTVEFLRDGERRDLRTVIRERQRRRHSGHIPAVVGHDARAPEPSEPPRRPA